MSDLTRTATAQTTHPSQSPAPSGLLQRQCACGQHTAAGGECAACRQKRQGALQRSPSGLAINRPGDGYEQEAERVAAAVLSGGELPGRTLSSAPALRRDGPPAAPSPRDPSADERRKYPGASLPDLGFNEPKNDQHVQQPSEKTETNEDRLGAAGEGLLDPWLATKLGKEVSDQIERFGAPFVATLGSTVVSVSAAISTVAAIFTPMYIRNEEIPIQPPAIKIAPGLKVRLTYKGPAQAPTDASVTFIYEPQEARKPQASDTDRTRADTEHIDADQSKFKEGKKTPAERAAEKRDLNAITGGLLSRPGNILGVPGYPYRRRDEGLLQRDAAGSSDLAVAPPIVHDVLSSPGQPLDPATRSFMEPRFGRDFSGVRVHTDGRAAASARDVRANAYTVGHNVVFGASRYAPETQEGRRLIAHELTHVVQQSGTANTPQRLGISASGEPAEVAAKTAVARLRRGVTLQPLSPQPAQISREPSTQPAPSTPILGTSSGRIIQIDNNVVAEVGKGNAIVAQKLRELCHSPGVKVQIDRGVYTAETTKVGVHVTAAEVAARKLMIEKLGIEVVGISMEQRADTYQNFAKDPAGSFTKHGASSVSGKAMKTFRDLPHIATGSASKAEIWSFDTGVKDTARNLNIRVALESDLPQVQNPSNVQNIIRLIPEITPADLASTIKPVQAPNTGTGAAKPPTATSKPTAGLSIGPSVSGVKPPTASSQPTAGLGTEPSAPGAKLPTSGGQSKSGLGKAGGIGPGLVKHAGGQIKSMFRPTNLAVMILHMANQYQMEKAEHERAEAMIKQKIGSSDIHKLTEDLLSKHRIEITRKQYRNQPVYITISLHIYFTNDVIDELHLSRGPKLSDTNESSFVSSVMSHDPIVQTEGKVWYVGVSELVQQLEISRLEAIKFRLEEIEELGNTVKDINPQELGILSQERNSLLEEQQKVGQEEARAKKQDLARPSVISDPQKRAQQQSEIRDQLRRLEETQKATEPMKQEAPKAPSGSPSLLPAPPIAPPSFLPGSPGEGPIEQAARVVTSGQIWAQQLEAKGTALTHRLGSNNSPTDQERQAFLNEEIKWRLAVKFFMNKFHENSREEAVNGLGELLDRMGPKLAQMRIRLGGN